ncbi:glycosyltransferase [Calothrix sp. PCC 6303]|uniref:glycosyltransferase n=1 Tax=Calothrix sp. PCC 6303 TaxID=1170562 RepID=UPI0002A01FE8|nr:glycosyltransferase [Calothrix sp. PCC 6303]AFZ01182.1 glycosyl transferase group 1 [Calothrix sp. PCC 6303]
MSIKQLTQNKQTNRIMLFDLSIKGHHPSYIQYLIKYWEKHNFDSDLSKNLNIVVSPKFIQEHGDVVSLVGDSKNIKFTAISAADESILNARKTKVQRNLRNFREWSIYCKYAKSLQIDRALIMYFDTCGLPLALGAKSPCSFSGIYFRPTFHYNEFDEYKSSLQDKVQATRENILLSRILRNPQLQNLFCLDPFAISYLNKFHSQTQCIHLPDPMEIIPSKNSSFGMDSIEVKEIDVIQKLDKQKLGVEPGRKIFLLFGAITSRKGIYQLLKSLKQLSDDICRQTCILIVGECGIKSSIEKLIIEVCQEKPLQIIRRYEFIKDEEIQPYFQLTDFVLAPYQKHVGMSGILLWAAATEKNVLSSNYGLMGEMVRRYKLGIAIDSTVPEEIAKGITKLLLEKKTNVLDEERSILMKSFIEQNSAERYARTILDRIL